MGRVTVACFRVGADTLDVMADRATEIRISPLFGRRLAMWEVDDETDHQYIECKAAPPEQQSLAREVRS